MHGDLFHSFVDYPSEPLIDKSRAKAWRGSKLKHSQAKQGSHKLKLDFRHKIQSAKKKHNSHNCIFKHVKKIRSIKKRQRKQQLKREGVPIDPCGFIDKH